MDKETTAWKRLAKIYKKPENLVRLNGHTEAWVPLDDKLRLDLAASIIAGSRFYLKELSMGNSGFIYSHEINITRGLVVSKLDKSEWEFTIIEGEIFMRSTPEKPKEPKEKAQGKKVKKRLDI